MNVGSARQFSWSSRWLAAFCDSRSKTFCDKTFSARLRSRPSVVAEGAIPMPPGAVSRLLTINGVGV